MKSVGSLSAHKTQDKRREKNDHDVEENERKQQTSTRSVLVKIDKYGSLRCNIGGIK